MNSLFNILSQRETMGFNFKNLIQIEQLSQTPQIHKGYTQQQHNGDMNQVQLDS